MASKRSGSTVCKVLVAAGFLSVLTLQIGTAAQKVYASYQHIRVQNPSGTAAGPLVLHTTAAHR